MDRYNVCKFPLYTTEMPLKVNAFVWEKDKKIIEQKKSLEKHYVYLITNGNGVFLIDNKEYSLQIGDLIFAFRGEKVHCTRLENLEYAYLRYEGARSNELFERFNVNKTNRVFRKLDFLIPFWKESLFHAIEKNIDLTAESMLLYTFSKLKVEKKEEIPIIEQIMALTSENYSSPNFNLKVLAKKLNYNEKYISHVFKQYTKTGFVEYLRSLRIKNAISLFDIGLNSIKNVALLSGFSDPLYFSAVFKKEIGVSPKQYINKNKTEY